MGGSCFLRRGEKALLLPLAGSEKAPPRAGAGSCRSYFQEREFFFSSSKDGTRETVTRGICSGLLGPPDLPERVCGCYRCRPSTRQGPSLRSLVKETSMATEDVAHSVCGPALVRAF